MVINARTGPFMFSAGRHWGFFYPQGKLTVIDNPPIWKEARPWAARLIVGFNVGRRPRWKLADLLPIVKRVRTRQSGDPAATFLAQKGIYKHARSGLVVTENGAQVFIIAHRTTPAIFRRQMIALAETIARELRQAEVVLELQHGGITREVMGIAP